MSFDLWLRRGSQEVITRTWCYEDSYCKKEKNTIVACCFWRNSNANHAYFAITQKLVHRPTVEHASQPGPSRLLRCDRNPTTNFVLSGVITAFTSHPFPANQHSTKCALHCQSVLDLLDLSPRRRPFEAWSVHRQYRFAVMRTFDMLLDKLGSDTYHVLSFPVFHHVQRLKSVYYVFLCYTCHVTGEYEHARKKPHKLGKNRMLVKEKALLYYLRVFSRLKIKLALRRSRVRVPDQTNTQVVKIMPLLITYICKMVRLNLHGQ